MSSCYPSSNNSKTKSSSVPKGATYTATGGIYKNGRWQDITAYASGGMPSNSGEIFIAREAGPELVGTIGGQTAVANQSQIVEAVAQGVASAVSAVLGNGNRGGQTIQMVVDGKVLYQTVVNENNRQIQRTGASALRA